jgi:hypothetical protein
VTEDVGKLLFGDPAVAAAVSRESAAGSRAPRRIAADPEATERGLAGLVLAIIDLVRQLLERQAVRRMEGGSLSDDEIERLGRALMGLEEKITELRDVFGLKPEDLDLPLDLSGLLDGPRSAGGSGGGRAGQ